MKNAQINLLNTKEVFCYKTECFDENLIEVYRKIESIFISLLEKYSSKFKIKNCVFYFDNTRYCSSSATNIGDKINIIKLSCAYPHLMFQKLYQNNILEENDTIKSLYGNLLNDNFNLKDFFLECSVRFTFFHELRHLIQFENKSNLFSEKRNSKFSVEKHLFEIDADLFSIRYILDYVFDTFSNLKNKTEENFIGLTYLSLSSVFTTNLLYYFKDIDLMESRLITNFQDEFYTERFSHPHNLIRITNLLEFFNENVNINYPVNKTITDFMKYSFEICNIFLKDNIKSDINLTSFYFEQLERNLNEINSYNLHLYNLTEKHEKIKRIRTKFNNVL